MKSMIASRKGTGVLFTLALVSVLYLAVPGSVQADHCPCDTQICTADGHLKTLTDFSVDTLAGTSSWTYEICVAAADGKCSDDATKSCQDNQDCWSNMCRKGGPNANTCSHDGSSCTTDKDCNTATCTGGSSTCRIDKFQHLSHIDILLPEVGTCLGETQKLSIAPDCSVNCAADLSCKTVEDRDPSCGLTNTKVLKCDVGDNDLDPGECVKIVVTVAGEVPTLGPGAIDEVTKVSTTCTTDQICGPACDCVEEIDNQCLTRTGGFWGTHPAITAAYDGFTVCGKTLDDTAAGSCHSTTEALCVAPGIEGDKKTCGRVPAYAQLVRQLTAAKLNLAATAANGGNCGVEIQTLIDDCEDLCDRSQSAISSSGCIEALDAFNNSQDTFAITPPPFDNPGRADPSQCQAASGNGYLIGKACQVNCK